MINKHEGGSLCKLMSLWIIELFRSRTIRARAPISMWILVSSSKLISVASYVSQRVRRIFEEQARWQESGPRRRVKCTSPGTTYCVVNNYNIVASRGELARNNRATNDTTTTTTASVITKRRTSSIVNGRIHSKEETTRSGILAAEEPRKLKDVSKDSARSGISRGIQRGIIKSASVPKDLKEGALHNF